MTIESAPLLLEAGCPEPDDEDVTELLDAARDATGAAWVELRLTPSPGDERRTYRLGRHDGAEGVELDLPVGNGFTATLAVGAGAVPPAETTRMITVGLAASLRAHRFLDQAALLGSVLDTTASAVLLFDVSGSIVYVNPPGDELLAEQTENELVIDSGDRDGSPLITHVCRRVEEMLNGSSDQATRREALSLTDGSMMVCELLRVCVGARPGATGVLALLQRVGGVSQANLEAFSDSHGLSPREVEVTRLLLDGCTTAGIATRLGISSHTVRDHLKHVYRKTDTGSRGELISRVAGSTVVPINVATTKRS